MGSQQFKTDRSLRNFNWTNCVPHQNIAFHLLTPRICSGFLMTQFTLRANKKNSLTPKTNSFLVALIHLPVASNSSAIHNTHFLSTKLPKNKQKNLRLGGFTILFSFLRFVNKKPPNLVR